MLEWFTEDSTVPVIAGFVMVVCLLGLALYSREKVMFYAAISVALLAALISIIETSIVTDREEVSAVLYEIQSTVAANEFEKTISYLDDEQVDTIARARRTLDGVVCEQCRILGIESIEVDNDARPRTATADFVVFAKVRRREMIYPPGTIRVELQLEDTGDGRWKIVDYKLIDPRSGTRLDGRFN